MQEKSGDVDFRHVLSHKPGHRNITRDSCWKNKREKTSVSTRIRRIVWPAHRGWVERSMNSEDTPRSRRWNVASEKEEVESATHPAVLDKLWGVGDEHSAMCYVLVRS